MKRTFLVIVVTGLASILVVVLLFVSSESIVHGRNTFLRQFPPHALKSLDTIDVGYNSFYIAGVSNDQLYLGNSTSTLRLMKIDLKSGDKSPVVIDLNGFDSVQMRSPRLRVDSPFFYIADGTVPVVLKGTISNWQCVSSIFKSAYFVDYASLNDHSIVMRSLSSKNGEYELAKQTQGQVQIFPDLLRKQVDGRFCTDGMLLTDNKTKNVVFVHYYRNEFIVADSSLNLIYRGRTIDTVSTAKIKIAYVPSIQLNSLAAPPKFVNKYSAVWREILFVNSGLLSKNENKDAFANSSVVDVYSLQQGNYEFSFYIPDHEGKKMHDFMVQDSLLVVLVDRHVLLFRLEPTYFSDKLYSKALHASQEKTEHL